MNLHQALKAILVFGLTIGFFPFLENSMATEIGRATSECYTQFSNNVFNYDSSQSSCKNDNAWLKKYTSGEVIFQTTCNFEPYCGGNTQPGYASQVTITLNNKEAVRSYQRVLSGEASSFCYTQYSNNVFNYPLSLQECNQEMAKFNKYNSGEVIFGTHCVFKSRCKADGEPGFEGRVTVRLLK